VVVVICVEGLRREASLAPSLAFIFLRWEGGGDGEMKGGEARKTPETKQKAARGVDYFHSVSHLF
jgi:hypothetical protein